MTVTILFVIATLILLGGLGFFLIRERERNYKAINTLKEHLQAVEKTSAMDRKYLEAMLQASQLFAEANDEGEIIDFVLNTTIEIAGCLGASFVPLDERGQPLAAMRQGDIPLPIPDAWLEYLASPAIRQTCHECKNHGVAMKTCPLLKGLFVDSFGMFCLPMLRGNTEIGILNLYMRNHPILPETILFIQSLLDTTALALEGLRLRKQELDTLGQLRLFQDKLDIKASITELVKEIHLALDADFAVLMIEELRQGKQQVNFCLDDLIVVGRLPNNGEEYIISWIEEVYSSGDPILKSEAINGKKKSVPTGGIIAVPIVSQGKPPIGAILIGKEAVGAFQKRQMSLLMTVATQAALIVETSKQIALHEYQAMLNERIRLAREIHDGLAQTLGYLKLQVAQMHGYLERGETERLKNMMASNYNTLAEAYSDVREAIDGLRHINLGGYDSSRPSVNDWLLPVVNEFRDLVAPIDLTVTAATSEEGFGLMPEIHAQLIRIVQEALSNIRKHAHAHQVWISSRYVDNDLLLEIIDDGVGFSADTLPGTSQHGLRGMRERAELIGADFQITSRPEGGTLVRIRLPLSEQEWMEAK